MRDRITPTVAMETTMTLRPFRILPMLLAALLWLTSFAAQAQAKSDYPLAAGDTIRIQVFQNPDLTLETRVSETGTITYPLIGSVDMGGLSIAAAEKRIGDALQKGGFIRQPQVTIVLLQVRGNQVSVLGQVNRPGRFPLETANTRLSDMLATAGGATPGGDDMVVITGQRGGQAFRRVIDLPSIYLNEKAADDIILMGGDTVYVHRAPVFHIYGEAQRPGSFRIERNMTVMQALAQGGGPTARGTENKLRLHRRGASGAVTQSVPKLTDPVQPDDVIYVEEAPVFFIYGEAQRPGSFRIEKDMTVMQALAQGGGPTARGSEKRLRLHRRMPDGSIQKITPELTDPVMPNDVLYVDERLF
jgi:polysaccharide biosynthesis/export protein